jgi:NDP-sugar pyrophosphorylase family protein
MILVGKFPILFHILKIYEKNGVDDFILALGYKGKINEKFFNKKYLEYLYGKDWKTPKKNFAWWKVNNIKLNFD